MSGTRVALIGCGRWGKNIARTLHKIGALAVVIDSDTQGAQEVVGQWGVEVSDDSLRAFSPDIQAVAIAAPAAQHYALCKQALLAKKHVFVEKPLALDIDQAEELAELAKSQCRTLMVGHLLQYHPAYVKLCELIRSGSIGEVRQISSNRINPGAIRTEENALWSLAPHDFSMILGLTHRMPVSVEALAVRVVYDDVPDQFFVQCRFSEHLTAHVNVSWLGPFKEHKLIVLGTKGALVFEDTATSPERKLVLYENYVNLSGSAPAFVKTNGVCVEFDGDEPLLREMTCFIDCVAHGSKSRSGSEEAIPVLKLLCAASESADVKV